MARIHKTGTQILESFDLPTSRYSFRSDGTVLRQFRIDGRLETARVILRHQSREAFARFASGMQERTP